MYCPHPLTLSVGGQLNFVDPVYHFLTDPDHKHSYSHTLMMEAYLQQGQFREALTSLRPQAECGDSCAEVLEVLHLDMLSYMLVSLDERKHIPKYLARPDHADVKDVMSHLMALERLLEGSIQTKMIFHDFVRVYYPNNVQTFFDTFTLRIHDDTHRQKFWKNVRSAVEQFLYTWLYSMKEFMASGSKQKLRGLQKKFSDVIQAMAIPLHDDTVPAIQYSCDCEYIDSGFEHCPLFTTAVRLKLAPEALLLYDAGAVDNKELGLLAKDPDVKNMLKSDDNSVLAVFLRKVLNKPRSLESLATMQVSRLLWCHAPGDKEKIARDLGLLDIDVERVLLRRQCGRYRAALKQADDEEKAGAS